MNYAEGEQLKAEAKVLREAIQFAQTELERYIGAVAHHQLYPAWLKLCDAEHWARTAGEAAWREGLAKMDAADHLHQGPTQGGTTGAPA